MILQEILDRRSIRRYTDRAIPSDQITELLRAAMRAPSARNTRSWRFLVIEERAALDHVAQIHPYAGMMRSAQAAVLVMGDRTAESEEGYLLVNCAAAIENLLLEAAHQGLGACWCGIAPRAERIEAFSGYFGLDHTLLPVGIVALGWPNEAPRPREEYEPEKVSYWKSGQ